MLHEALDYLTYCSWRAQIELYGMSKERARKLFNDYVKFEFEYERKKDIDRPSKTIDA